MRKLGLTPKEILGAILVKLAEPQGKRSTRQMIYITDHVDKLFLSQEAFADLGIIPTGFPSTRCDSTDTHSASYQDVPTPSDAPTPCSYPRRTPPPPKLTEAPFPTTPENRSKILLQRYKASTFNTCEHQPLPLMDRPPLRLMIDPNATPTAHHSPIPIPLHW